MLNECKPWHTLETLFTITTKKKRGKGDPLKWLSNPRVRSYRISIRNMRTFSEQMDTNGSTKRAILPVEITLLIISNSATRLLPALQNKPHGKSNSRLFRILQHWPIDENMSQTPDTEPAPCVELVVTLLCFTHSDFRWSTCFKSRFFYRNPVSPKQMKIQSSAEDTTIDSVNNLDINLNAHKVETWHRILGEQFRSSVCKNTEINPRVLKWKSNDLLSFNPNTRICSTGEAP